MDKTRVGAIIGIIVSIVIITGFVMTFAKDVDLKEVEKKAQDNTERIIKQETHYKFIYDAAVEQKLLSEDQKELNKSLLEVLKEVNKQLEETKKTK